MTSDTELISQVWMLYVTVLNQAAILDNYYPSVHHWYSACNLLAFLTYKNNINSELITALRMRGLRLSSIQHVAQSLKIMCSNLGIVPPLPVKYDEDPAWLAKIRRQEILGVQFHQVSPHIMLTLDAKMISSPIIEQYLVSGMTIARINCAYGDESTWANMIEAIRRAEDQLRKKGQYDRQRCKIYMDLAGPKIRVRRIHPIAHPLKIVVKNDLYGHPIRVKKGIISWRKATSKLLFNNVYDFEISIPPDDKLNRLQEGDHFSFLDAQNEKRKFLIIKVMPFGFVVSLDKTANINANTCLQNAENQIALNVMNIEENFVKVQLKKSDQLRIFLKDTLELHDACPSAIPGISVSLPQAFVNIKEGHSVYIDDGKIHGKVKGYNGEFVDVEIVSPEKPIILKENKGINLPDSNVSLSVPALTNKDEKDLAFICRHADLLGFSFVNHPDDLQKLKPFLSYYGKSDLPVIAKIETKEAVHNFSKILLEGLTFPNFGVMVARGDLAIEIGFQQLPVVQEEILAMCRAAHTPVILATQVLDTLAKKGIPSRPEMADLSFGSEFDCVMLNKGPFMKETVGFTKETLFLIAQFKDHKYGVTRPNDL